MTVSALLDIIVPNKLSSMKVQKMPDCITGIKN